MYLKKIEILGFKSFARKTVLEFDRGIISVVGPNGSGKSNLADAIRWVMGEQSMKAVRSKKSEDVIFAGSDKKSKQGMAEVAITFDNADRKISLDFSEVVISRRIFRDGDSEYLVNKRPARLMDIQEILSKSGYGGYSYHIISQGTIDQLLLGGPASVKSIIEEASGVKPYYTKRERAERKLERSEQNLLRVADLVAEIEPRLRSLKRQTRRMEQREEIQGSLREMQFHFFVQKHQKLKKELLSHSEKVAGFDGKISETAADIETKTKHVKAIEEKIVGNSGKYAKLQKELRDLEKQKNQVQESLATVRGQLRVKEPGQAPDQHGLQLRQSELQKKIKDLEERVGILRDQIVLSRKNLTTHEKINDNLEGDIAKIQKQIESVNTPIDFSQVKDEVDKVYSRYQSLVYQIKNLHSEEDFESLQHEAGNLEIILIKLKDKLVKFSSQPADESAWKDIHGRLRQIFSQKDKVQKEIGKIESMVAIGLSQKEFYDTQLADYTKELSEIQKILSQKPGSAKDWNEELRKKESELSDELQKFTSLISKLETDLKQYLDSEEAAKKELLQSERQLRASQDTIAKLKDMRGMVLIEKARQDANQESLQAEIRESLGEAMLQKIALAPAEIPDGSLEQQIHKLRGQLEMIGSVDDLTIQEYKETQARYDHLTSQSADLKKAVDDLRQVIAELDAVIKKQFQNGFDKINDQFSEFFRILFSGGRARMSLIKEKRFSSPQAASTEDIPSEIIEEETGGAQQDTATGREVLVGIDVRVTPPGKKLASISALSGGERALTSIALLMSILSSFPSPFIVLDEVDAALDEANSIRFAKILGRLAHQTQFITITHNRETMRQSRALYGVTMGDDGISKMLSIQLEKAVELAE